MVLDYTVRTRTCEEPLTGKQPLPSGTCDNDSVTDTDVLCPYRTKYANVMIFLLSRNWSKMRLRV